MGGAPENKGIRPSWTKLGNKIGRAIGARDGTRPFDRVPARRPLYAAAPPPFEAVLFLASPSSSTTPEEVVAERTRPGVVPELDRIGSDPRDALPSRGEASPMDHGHCPTVLHDRMAPRAQTGLDSSKNDKVVRSGFWRARGCESVPCTDARQGPFGRASFWLRIKGPLAAPALASAPSPLAHPLPAPLLVLERAWLCQLASLLPRPSL